MRSQPELGLEHDPHQSVSTSIQLSSTASQFAFDVHQRTADIPHTPVLLSAVLQALDIRENEVYIDGTFGRGGYARAILDTASSCSVWGIDRDPEAIAFGQDMVKTYEGRLKLLQGRFSQMRALLAAQAIEEVDGIVLDIGVSSPQLDNPARGFSFREDGPLDMRMEQAGPSAADIINTLPEKELADIIYTLGEERFSRHIARKIQERRLQAPLTSTREFAELVRSVVPRSKDGIDPATRTFQALRMYVNDELGELKQALREAEELLKPGGRLAVVSFHSLEDRCVKQFLKERSQEKSAGSRYAPPSQEPPRAPTFALINRHVICAFEEECLRNPRARSAKLRAARRTTAAIATKEK